MSVAELKALRELLREQEARTDRRIEDLRAELTSSIRNVHQRVDQINKDVAGIPGQILEAIVPVLRNGGSRAAHRSWFEVIPWKWGFVCVSLLSLVVLVSIGVANPEDVRDLVGALSGRMSR